MSSFVRVPTRMTLWKCPKCGAEKETAERPSPWIHTCLPSLFGRRAPACPKCKTRMIKVKLYFI